MDALVAPASGPSSRLTRQYYWMERPIEADSVLALSAELRRRDARVAIGADVHFYASREYNAMLTLIGVIPYGEAWMVFTINHTFTDQVQGLAPPRDGRSVATGVPPHSGSSWRRPAAV